MRSRERVFLTAVFLLPFTAVFLFRLTPNMMMFMLAVMATPAWALFAPLYGWQKRNGKGAGALIIIGVIVLGALAAVYFLAVLLAPAVGEVVMIVPLILIPLAFAVVVYTVGLAVYVKWVKSNRAGILNPSSGHPERGEGSDSLG